MRDLRKHLTAALLVLLLTLGLSGCVGSGGSELLTVPRTAVRYTQLYQQIEKMIDSGAEYAAPTGGSNRQTIQMEDLDGDGRAEAMVFLRGTDEIPLQLCLYKQVTQEPGREETLSFELKLTYFFEGNSFDSIAYRDLDGNGTKDLIVCCAIGAAVPKALTVFEFYEGEILTKLSESCSYYTICDLTSDGTDELVLTRFDADAQTGSVEVYRPEGIELLLADAAPLSQNLEGVTQVTAGQILYGVPALIVTGVCEQRTSTVTDILAYRLGQLVNVTLDPESGESVEHSPASAVTLMDVGGDGTIDIPTPVLAEESGDYLKTVWKGYRLDGVAEETYQTYQQTDWYFMLPDAWKSSFCAERRDTLIGERTVIFSLSLEEGRKVDLMTIYVLTGDNREDRSALAGRFVLGSSGGTIYAARLYELPEEYAEYAVTREEAQVRFKLITREWSTGERGES